MKSMFYVLIAAGLLLPQFVSAVESPNENPEKAKIEKKVAGKKQSLQEIAVTGKLEKQGRSFSLIEADGAKVRIRLPVPKKGMTPAVTAETMDALVGKIVTLKGKGTLREMQGKTLKTLKVVESVEEASALEENASVETVNEALPAPEEPAAMAEKECGKPEETPEPSSD